MTAASDLDHDELIRLASTGTDRVSRVDTGKRIVWVKRAAAKSLHIGHYLQLLCTLALPGTIYRPSPPEQGDAATRGEAERIRAFAAKGLPVPEILYQGVGALVLSDCGQTLEMQMKQARAAGDADRHDELLLLFATGISEMAAAELVHGRPHPRDCFVRDGRLGFMDFEQNPLAGMRLESAQARDAMFTFGFVCDLAKRPATPELAFDSWTARAPQASVLELKNVLRQLRPLLALGRLALRIHAGSDLRRFMAGTQFLSRKLGVNPDAAPAPISPIMTPRDRA